MAYMNRGVWGKHEGTRLPGRPKHRQKDNTNTDLKEKEQNSVEWIHVTHDRDKCQVLGNNNNEPVGCIIS